MSDTPPYPIVLSPILKDKVWGGSALSAFSKPIGEGTMIGESWELADLNSTSASGGGGGAAHSEILNGGFRGKTIRDVIDAWGEELLGDAQRSAHGGFPLLVKYLDARENLSIQVHPSASYADAHPDTHLKTESWYVLHAEPDAQIYAGIRDGVMRDQLRDAIDSGTVPSVMQTHKVQPGSCYTLASGMVHALGAGVVVAEVQTPSDTTFRVYDWANEYGRDGRELHIEPALQCASFDPPTPPVIADLGLSGWTDPRGGPPKMGSRKTRVSETPYYTMDVISASCDAVKLADDCSSPLVIMVPRTMGASIASGSDTFEEVMLEPGQTAVVPASCAQDAVLRAGPGTECLVIRAL